MGYLERRNYSNLLAWKIGLMKGSRQAAIIGMASYIVIVAYDIISYDNMLCIIAHPFLLFGFASVFKGRLEKEKAVVDKEISDYKYEVQYFTHQN